MINKVKINNINLPQKNLFQHRSSKKGQFYLVAAIIIIVVIVGFVSINNGFISVKSNSKIYDLKKELNIEGANVIDHGIYDQKDSTEMQALIENFTELYHSFAGSDTRNMVFVYGDRDTIKIRSFGEIASGSTSVEIGGVVSALTLYKPGASEITIMDVRGKDSITVVLGEQEYYFQLGEGENFYFIISESAGGETQIVNG